MFKNSEAPISLFSFQDIVTSLTGIMLVFVLLLSLELIQSKQKKQQESPLYAEMESAKEQKTAAEVRLHELEEDYREMLQISAEVANYDASTMEARKHVINDEITKIKDSIIVLQNERTRIENELKDYRNQEIALIKKDKQAQIVQKDNAKLTEENELLQEKRDKLVQSIEKKKKQLKVNFTGYSDKKPVLVECSAAKIRISAYESDKIHVINGKTPMMTDMLKEMFQYLTGFSQEKFYFVFLIKPSAAAFSTVLRLQLIEQKYEEVGFEPILEDEEAI